MYCVAEAVNRPRPSSSFFILCARTQAIRGCFAGTVLPLPHSRARAHVHVEQSSDIICRRRGRPRARDGRR